MSGTMVAGYELLEPLPARFHYRARSESGDIVALQILPSWRRSDEALARFNRELEFEQATRHENVAELLDSGSTLVTDPELVGGPGAGDVLYIVREFVAGRTVAQMIDEGVPPMALAISIAIQSARGLAALHAQNVVHRNLRPETLALREDGVLKLIDFGLVKILRDEASKGDAFKTEVGQVVGTAGYMAPEQLRGQKVDARTDLFALGAVLYELICGKPPFPTGNLLEYFRAVEHDDPTPLRELRDEVPASLEAVIGRMLQKDPADRQTSAVEVESELIEVLGDPAI